jgi:hypothetical protein
MQHNPDPNFGSTGENMTVTPLQKLYALPSYRALNPKRRKLATAILVEGLSLSAACRILSLNMSREVENLDLQKCLADYRGANPTTDVKNRGKGFEDDRDEVMSCLYHDVECLAAKEAGLPEPPWGLRVPSLEAVFAYEEAEYPSREHATPLPGLDRERIATFITAYRTGVAELNAKMNPIRWKHTREMFECCGLKFGKGCIFCSTCKREVTQPADLKYPDAFASERAEQARRFGV